MTTASSTRQEPVATHRRRNSAIEEQPAGRATFTQIAVHLTGSVEDEVRLGYAEQVARTFDAHLTGLFVGRQPEFWSGVDPIGSAVLNEVIEQARQKAQEMAAALERRFARFDFPNDVRTLEAASGGIGRRLAAAARTSDLFIGTRPYGDPTGEEYVEEDVLFGSGHGCLLVPPGGQPPRSYQNILIAWKETREAARAVAEALPFLQRARQVIVALFEEDASEQFHMQSGADIGRYLSRHGVSAEIRNIGGWTYTGEAILNEAKQTASDMIVMGAYGHSRFREWLLGGATREVLANATVPVLIAH